MNNVKDFAGFKNGQAHLVGQPFTIHTLHLPVSAVLTCNCGGPAEDTKVEITLSEPATCKSCSRQYNVAFNPQKNAVEFMIANPELEKPAS